MKKKELCKALYVIFVSYIFDLSAFILIRTGRDGNGIGKLYFGHSKSCVICWSAKFGCTSSDVSCQLGDGNVIIYDLFLLCVCTAVCFMGLMTN